MPTARNIPRASRRSALAGNLTRPSGRALRGDVPERAQVLALLARQAGLFPGGAGPAGQAPIQCGATPGSKRRAAGRGRPGRVVSPGSATRSKSAPRRCGCRRRACSARPAARSAAGPRRCARAPRACPARPAITGRRLRPWNSRSRAALAEHAEDVGDGRRQVEQVHQSRDAQAAGPAPEEADDERDVDALLVELHVVADPAVLAAAPRRGRPSRSRRSSPRGPPPRARARSAPTSWSAKARLPS